MLKEQGMTWAEAKAFCEGLGANMVLVDSVEEKDLITAMLAEPSARKQRTWVGVKKVGDDLKALDGVTTPAYQPFNPSSAATGDCVRTDGNSDWWRQDCEAKDGSGGYPFNPLCKK